MIKHMFVDMVKDISPNAQNGVYSVIFKKHASFYKIHQSKAKDIQLLHQSHLKEEKVMLEVDAETMEIWEVSAMD